MTEYHPKMIGITLLLFHALAIAQALSLKCLAGQHERTADFHNQEETQFRTEKYIDLKAEGLTCHSKESCDLDCTGSSIFWGYNAIDGPQCWGDCYDVCGTGTRQSPIDVHQADVEEVTYTPLQLDGYDVAQDMTLFNDGHSAKLTLATDAYRISGLGLDQPYIADSFHFHWGIDDDEGSEHEIGSQVAPLEMHIVHYSSNFSSLGEALGLEGGVAVLGFMFHVGFEDNPFLADIVDSLPSIAYKGDSTILRDQVLENLLPHSYTGSFYRYDGSLTTPSCTEGLVWTLFADSIPISKNQLESFRSSLYRYDQETADNELVTYNFRPVQPINGRKVLHGYNSS